MPKTILVIDDDLGLQTVLSISLKQAGYRTVFASNGEDGLEQVGVERPDLVICDVMMPQLDGVQFFQTIKESLQGEGVPIIIMTALSRKAWFSDLEAEGAIIIQKPFDMDHVLSMIRLLLDDEDLEP